MRKTLLALLSVLVLLVAACGDDDASDNSPDEGGEDSSSIEVVTVENLEEIVTDVADAFADEQPDAEVQISLVEDRDGLRDALESGDVVVGPRSWLVDAADNGLTDWGRNLAVIAVPAGNPDAFDTQTFAPDGSARTKVCGEDSSLGNFSVAVLERGGVSPDPDTVEAGCEQTALDQIAAGELDAAVMYRSGLDVPEGVELVEIPEDQNIVIRVVATPAGGSETAKSFAAFGESDAARSILESEGFLP